MVYCHHCGNKFEKGDSFCRSCGNRLPRDIKKGKVEEKPIKEKIEKEKTKKKKYIFLGVAVIIVIALILIFVIDGEETGFTIGGEKEEGFSDAVVEKEACPYECCLEGEYYAKLCSQNYECLNNICIAIDSDSDGLTDLEEIEIGTNPQLFDSDGDTLSDYQEYINLGTNPLNKNSDGDRYDDNEDDSPLETNSADIIITTTNNVGDWTIGIFEIVTMVANPLDFLDTIISDRIIYTEIRNNGDDYTSYVEYDIEVYVKYGTESPIFLDKRQIKLNNFDAGERVFEETYYEFTLEDYGPELLNQLLYGEKEYIIEYKNIKYERFG